MNRKAAQQKPFVRIVVVVVFFSLCWCFVWYCAELCIIIIFIITIITNLCGECGDTRQLHQKPVYTHSTVNILFTFIFVAHVHPFCSLLSFNASQKRVEKKELFQLISVVVFALSPNEQTMKEKKKKLNNI